MAAKSSAASSEKQSLRSRIFGERNSRITSNSDYHTVSQRRAWSPGLQRSPWMALLAIFITVAAIATCIGILVGSDGKPVNRWTFQPTVYLAIATTVANICLHFAFAEGVTIVWWRKALGATTVGELHRAYDHGRNFWAALFAYRYVNFVAIACLMVTISPINGPLMQRASQITTDRSSSVPVSLEVPTAAEIPAGFTAYTSGRTQSVSFLQRDFIPVVSEWNTQSPIRLKTACSGTCTGVVRGAGFSVNCTRSTLSFDLKPFPNPLPDSWTQYITSTVGFEVRVDQAFPYGSPSNSGTISVAIKNTTAHAGELQIQNCTLQPATVSFPITVDGNQQTIALRPGTTIWDDVVERVSPEQYVTDSRTTFGGLYKALKDRYSSWASISTEPVLVGIFQSEGFYANAYAVIPPDETLGIQSLDLSYADPLPDLLQSARELMFRTAIASAPFYANATTRQIFRLNETTLAANTQAVTVTQSTSEARYRSEYAWLAGALLATIIPTLAVLGLFWGYWMIGRRVTLSPIETAKALGSPLLVSEDGNSTARELVREIGGRKVRYGGVARDKQGASLGDLGDVDGVRRRPGQRDSDHQSLQNGHEMGGEDGGPMLKLQMRSPDSVLAPLKGWVFAG